jgi:lysophospholipase L1-like esterase
MMRWRSGLAVAAIGTLGLTLLTGVPAPSEAQAAPSLKKVVAIGDSVMAGFGYYPTDDTGVITSNIPEMSALDLPGCRPVFTDGFGYNGSCSANVLEQSNTSNVAPDVRWAADYGYWNQIAWSSQFAREINAGLDDTTIAGAYRNFALSGSTAAEWADDSLVFRPLQDPDPTDTDDTYTGLGAVIAEAPHVITITVGANPTLAKMLFGEGNRCRFVDDKYSCFVELINEDRTPQGLRTIYRTLLTNTSADVVVMLYPNIIPAVTLFTAEQILIALKALNTTISDAVNDVRNDDPTWATRIGTVYRQFNTGLPPGSYTAWSPCFGPSALGKGVDGPSNQSSATQQVFAVTRKLTGWCEGDPWIISGDTGIHPNLRGYAAMSGRAVETYKAMVGDVPRAVPVLYFADPPQSAQVGESYGPYQFLASGSPLPIFTLADDTSVLPPGMQLTARGSLGGIPTTAGTYSFRVRVSNGIDDTTPVSGTMAIEVRAAPTPAPPPGPEAPSRPLGVVALPGDSSALVTWSAPARDGGSAITSYEVTAAPGGATCTTTGALTCAITGLTNGTRYSFTVRARNGGGLSPASEASRAVTPRSGALLISGSRGTGTRVEQSKVTITGLAAGLEADAATITFTSVGGSARMLSRRDVPVSFDGRFTMTRRLNSGARVVAMVAGVASNAVVIPALGAPRR